MKDTFAAAILAGGMATRFSGIAKGNIKLKNDVTIIQRLINELSRAECNEIIIVANDSSPYISYGIKVMPDLQKGLGPIGGIETALTYYLNKYAATIFLPCDLPAVTAMEIERLKGFYLHHHARIVYAKTKITHPLCAIVNNSLAGEVSELIKIGERKISTIWERLVVKAVYFENNQPFANLNTWTDMENCRSISKCKILKIPRSLGVQK